MKLKLLLIFFLQIISTNGKDMKLNIIPTPQNIIVSEQQNNFRLGGFVNITFTNLSNTEIKRSIDLLNSELANYIGSKKDGTLIELLLVDTFNPEGNIPFQLSNEAYILEINENNFKITATSPRGIFYGSQSLIQLAESNSGLFQSCKIIDYPDMKFRGISDDISRGQVSTMQNFKRIIDFLAKYKMNTYMPYMEDVIQFDSYPGIGVGRGALSKDEIKEIVKYAEERFIEVIPIFQTLGHYENILSQSEFIKYADFPGGASLDITNEETYTFLETMLNEVFELFPSKYFHMGADESYDIGLGKSRNLVEQSDMATVHANHYKRVYDICKKNNKEVMMYGDIILSHPEILEKIPKDIIIVDWHYFPKYNYPSTKTFSNAGFDYIVSPTVWNFNSAFPENFDAIPNIKTLTEDGLKNNSIGMINSSWGDFGAETFREYNLYGYAWSAQCSWNISNSKVERFNHVYNKQFFGVDLPAIEELFSELNDPMNQLLWNDIWRHPLLPDRKTDWRQLKLPQPSKHYWMCSNNDGLKLLNEIKTKATKNKDFLELLTFTFELKDWHISKQKAVVELNNILDSNSTDVKNAIELVNTNIKKLSQLKYNFTKNWIKYNRPDNLWMVEEKFDRIIIYFEEIKDQLLSETITSPTIQSPWIYYPNEDNEELITKALFSLDINLDEKIKSAKIQLIGDTFAKLIINNKEVDSVYTKRSGSLWIEQQRVKLLDISEYLESGENNITVEARNYYTSKTPGINIISEVITESNKIVIMSNETWQVKKDNSEEWVPVELKENSLEIIAPNFETNRKSWIER